jgi:hypothetical protein
MVAPALGRRRPGGAGTAGTAIAFAGAQRTSSAYRDYLDRADVGDVVINPSTSTREIDEHLRSLQQAGVATTD